MSERNLRCLWLTRDDPRSEDAGDLLYSSQLIRSVALAGAQVTVLATKGTGEHQTADRIEWVLVPRKSEEMTGRFAYKSVLSRYPNVATQYHTREYERALNRLLWRDWDAIVVDHLGMGWVWDRVRKHYAGMNSKMVFVSHQCEGALRRQMARNYAGNALRKAGLYLDAEKAWLLERKIIRTASLFTVISDQDRVGFGGGILLSPGYSGPRRESREITPSTPRRVLLFGSGVWFAKQMNMLEFITAADDVFSSKGIELCVVGRVADGVKGHRPWRATKFLGFVPDPADAFSDARVGVIPERTGGGFKLKSLDYVFNRLPIAAITGSVSGLPLVAGDDYMSFDTMQGLVSGIVSGIDDFPRLNRLHEAAYRNCEDSFEWRDRGHTLVAALEGKPY